MIDGDGTGDDRRLNVLLKTFTKWANSSEINENNQMSHDKILSQMAQCEFTVSKSDFSSQMMKQELTNYASISKTIESGIELAKSQIEQSKKSLVLAKKIRKNRIEYDVLAKIITQQPDRKQTVKQLDLLKKDLNELKNNRRQMQSKLETKRKNFTVLMRSIKELQNTLGSDSEDELEIVTEIDAMSCDGELLSPIYPMEDSFSSENPNDKTE